MTRRLGNSTLEVSPLCLGTNVFGWTADEPAAFQILDAFTDSGFNFIDTADVYSTWVPGHTGGESETIIGNWGKRTGKRDKLVIATKVGFQRRQGLSKSYILRAVEDSLHRLQTDHIDLYQSHSDDSETPFEETFEAYDQLIRQGKVRFIGASNYTADRLAAALRVSDAKRLPRYVSLQPLYNLYDRAEYETSLEPLCMKERLGVIPYFSLAAGFLTGKYRSESDLAKSPRGGRAKKYMDERGFRILRALDEVAARCRSTPASVALAWLRARPSITAPIASATNLEQLNDLISATRLQLDPASIEELNVASDWH